MQQSPDSTFENCKQTGPKCILGEEHKAAIVDFIDANISATAVEVTEHLLKRFTDLKVSHSTVHNFMRGECNLSLKKADSILLKETVQRRLRSDTIGFANAKI